MQALDQAIFDAPYIVIDRDNNKVVTATTADAARVALHQHAAAVSIVGTARAGIEVVDVDAADTGAPAEAGTAASEDLRDWLTGYGLPYLRRASGRPGGHHLIARVPAELLDAFAAYVADVAVHHGVAATLRVPRTLRLLTAEHRHGNPAPVLDGTMTPADAPAASTSPARAPKRPACRPAPGPSGTGQQTASEREYGRTCAAIRRGLNFTQTWAILGDCQVVERGQADFRKYMWFPAVTEIAAERGLDEDAAWDLAREASAARARALGRRAWRDRYWLPAVERAADPAQRRVRRLTDRPDEPTQPDTVDPAQRAAAIERTRTAMHDAAADLIASFRPQRQKSIRAVIDALAVALVSRDGSIDVRTLAEQACVSKGVTVQVKADLTEHGIIAVAEKYGGGADDCHRYVLGPRADQALPQNETTRWYTPTPRTYGHANPERMRLHHVRERTRWKLRCTLEEATRQTGERWSTSQHPAAKTARSLWAQRARWDALPDDVQEQKRKQRRAFLGKLDPGERSRWFDWLNKRDSIAQAAARARTGQDHPADVALLTSAPMTVHLGMRERTWLDGPTAGRAGPSQLLLFNRAA
ncbi:MULTISPECIES: hypothetical protein [unclassified Amycolatopsis]|uniref:hypothetical protein n=1 Tax=unclassified Amycolatopsis TaxID=2618356 RepID=UPI002876E44F|nr:MULTISPECIES: hypothetical protein [unclassified Amycolatopsis]MDS0140600.1 hypothetical protein [Amycolatopsis sp. 505]MDS0149250.1 hypothetical protein [Amycolatopsis sp. CM201R]